MTHPKLPYALDAEPSNRLLIATTPLGQEITAAGWTSGVPRERVSEMRGVGEFIVRACNAHEDLLEACKAAYNFLDAGYSVSPSTGEIENALRDAILKAQASDDKTT